MSTVRLLLARRLLPLTPSLLPSLPASFVRFQSELSRRFDPSLLSGETRSGVRCPPSGAAVRRPPAPNLSTVSSKAFCFDIRMTLCVRGRRREEGRNLLCFSRSPPPFIPFYLLLFLVLPKNGMHKTHKELDSTLAFSGARM